MKKTDLIGVPDKNKVLEYRKLSDTAEAFKILENDGLLSEEVGSLDIDDLNNLEKWYFSYRALYSYKSKKRKLSKNEKQKFSEIEKSKGDLDIMNLVEISIGRLLEKYFYDTGINVRVRKTTTYDDVNSGMDYIIEFLDDKNKVSEIVGIDLTISENEYNLWKKSLREKSKPSDYLYYIKNKEEKSFDFIPRLVLKLDKNLVYSFTNNFFTEVIEKGDTLNNEEIGENFLYAVDDLKNRNISMGKEDFSSKIQEVILDSKQKAKHLI